MDITVKEQVYKEQYQKAKEDARINNNSLSVPEGKKNLDFLYKINCCDCTWSLGAIADRLKLSCTVKAEGYARDDMKAIGQKHKQKYPDIFFNAADGEINYTYTKRLEKSEEPAGEINAATDFFNDIVMDISHFFNKTKHEPIADFDTENESVADLDIEDEQVTDEDLDIEDEQITDEDFGTEPLDSLDMEIEALFGKLDKVKKRRIQSSKPVLPKMQDKPLIKEMNNAYDVREKQLAVEERKIKDRDSDLQQREYNLDKQVRELETRRQEFIEKSASLEQEKESLNKLRKKMSEKEKELLDSEKSLKSRQALLDSRERMCDAAKKDNDNKEKQLKERESIILEKEKAVYDRETDLLSLESELSVISKTLKVQKSNLEYAKKELAEQEAKIKALPADNMENAALTAAINEKDEEIAEYTTLLSSFKAKMSEVNNKYKGTVQANRQLEEQIGKIKKRNDGLLKDKKKLTEQVKDLKKVLEKAKLSDEHKQDEINSTKDSQIEDLKKQIEALKADKESGLAEKGSELADKESEITQLKNRIVELESKDSHTIYVRTIKEQLSAADIPSEVLASEGPITLKVQRDGCDIYLNEEEGMIYAEKAVKNANKYKGQVDEWNKEDLKGMYLVTPKKITLKHVLSNDAVQDVLNIAERLRSLQ